MLRLGVALRLHDVPGAVDQDEVAVHGRAGVGVVSPPRQPRSPPEQPYSEADAEHGETAQKHFKNGWRLVEFDRHEGALQREGSIARASPAGYRDFRASGRPQLGLGAFAGADAVERVLDERERLVEGIVERASHAPSTSRWVHFRKGRGASPLALRARNAAKQTVNLRRSGGAGGRDRRGASPTLAGYVIIARAALKAVPRGASASKRNGE